MTDFKEANKPENATETASPVDVFVMCNIELTGDYHIDYNLLINEIESLRKGISDITKMQPKVLSNFEPIETLAMSPTELIHHVHRLLR